MSVAPQHQASPLSARTGKDVRRTPVGRTITTLATGSALLAACATPAPVVPPPPPPPPVVEAVPYRPLPPGGAHYLMDIPPRGADGKRLTVNSGINDDHLVWHLRSAWNVAALNCLAPEYEPILQGYRNFLMQNERSLKAANDRIEAEYARKHKTKRAAMVARDGLVTKVYNFFALPAARSGFCRAALDMSSRALAAPASDALSFARANFDGLLVPFDTFFDEYEAYQRASAEWDAKWGAQYGPSQPGWVVVQQAHANGQPMPVVPATESVSSQPVVSPLPADPQRMPER
jgi:hypothetical protein